MSSRHLALSTEPGTLPRVSPRVYVEETDTGNKPIEGVSTSTAGAVGMTERGPVNVPILITSTGEYTRWFGQWLRREEFSNALGAHCYLPHAIDGFFTNGGKRIYVTRVLDTNAAANSEGALFDRGGATSANTVLLRSMGEETGTVISPPLPVVLPDANLALNDWIRIGDGSDAEYRRITAVPTTPDTVAIPLHLPIGRSHADPAGATITVEQFKRGTIGAGYTIVMAAPATRTERGARILVIQGASADLNNFVNVNMNDQRLLELGPPNLGELRFVTSVVRISTTQVRVELDSPLLLTYGNSDPVAQLNPPLSVAVVTPPLPKNIDATTPAQALLDPSARVGDTVLFVLDRGTTDFSVRTDLIVINRSDTATREVRRIGELRRVTLNVPAANDYPSGAIVQGVSLRDDTHIQMNAAAAGAVSFVIPNAAQGHELSVGQHLLLGGSNPEEVVVQSIVINPGSPPGTTTVTLAAPGIQFAKVVGVPVAPVRALTAGGRASANLIAINNRLGLSVGDVLQIGSGVSIPRQSRGL